VRIGGDAGHPAAAFFVAAEAFWISLACLFHWRRIYLRL
jgi:hypothetical protein